MFCGIERPLAWIACCLTLACLSFPTWSLPTIYCVTNGAFLSSTQGGCSDVNNTTFQFNIGCNSTYPRAWYSFQTTTATDNLAGGVFPQLGGGSTNYFLRNSSANHYVEPGATCPTTGSSPLVVLMTISDYQSMIDGANVKAEMLNAENYWLVGLLGLIFLMAFAWGWKIVQRGGSQ
jgi:hypothetical protein